MNLSNPAVRLAVLVATGAVLNTFVHIGSCNTGGLAGAGKFDPCTMRGTSAAIVPSQRSCVAVFYKHRGQKCCGPPDTRTEAARAYKDTSLSHAHNT